MEKYNLVYSYDVFVPECNLDNEKADSAYIESRLGIRTTEDKP